MKHMWLMTVASALLVLGSCTVIPGGEENAASEVLENFIKTVADIHAEYGDDWDGGSSAVLGVIDNYIYFDDSLSESSDGIEGTREWVASMIYGHAEMLAATATVEDVEIVNSPTDVPTPLVGKVEAKAVITMGLPDSEATCEAYTVRISGKWYVEAIYWDSEANWQGFYPWDFIPEINCSW